MQSTVPPGCVHWASLPGQHTDRRHTGALQRVRLLGSCSTCLQHTSGLCAACATVAGSSVSKGSAELLAGTFWCKQRHAVRLALIAACTATAAAAAQRCQGAGVLRGGSSIMAQGVVQAVAAVAVCFSPWSRVLNNQAQHAQHKSLAACSLVHALAHSSSSASVWQAAAAACRSCKRRHSSSGQQVPRCQAASCRSAWHSTVGSCAAMLAVLCSNRADSDDHGRGSGSSRSRSPSRSITR